MGGFGTVGTLTAAALLAQLVEHLHGKEGVDGSSPSEGLFRTTKPLQKAGFSVAITDTAEHLLCKEGINH